MMDTDDELMGRVGVSTETVASWRNSILDALVQLVDCGLSPDAARARILAAHDQQVARIEAENPRAAEVLVGPMLAAVEGAFADLGAVQRLAATPSAPFFNLDH